MSNGTEALSTNQILQDKIEELKGCLKVQHPKINLLLKEIWTTLKNYPENATLLVEEEISTIVEGLEHITSISIAAAVPKPKGKAMSKLELEDF